jgi:hypothetical protein
LVRAPDKGYVNRVAGTEPAVIRGGYIIKQIHHYFC